jgi:hypothetical protein
MKLASIVAQTPFPQHPAIFNRTTGERLLILPLAPT